MKFALLAAFILLALPSIGLAQAVNSNSVCVPGEGAQAAKGAVLTICTHEFGMTSFPQPQLYLRIFADGRAEYETVPPFQEGAGFANQLLTKKELRLSPEQVQEIIRLGSAKDFQQAPAAYPAFHIGTDSGVSTTISFRDQSATKTIVVTNFSWRDPDNGRHYPRSLIILMSRMEVIRDKAAGTVRAIPFITFCQLIKGHELLFDMPVSLAADMELGGTNEFLNEPECDEAIQGVWRTTERIGVGYLGPDDNSSPALKAQTEQIHTPRFSGRARVSITGFLRNESKRTSDGYKYRFDITAFNSIDPIVLPYRGELEPGWSYSDSFDQASENRFDLSSRLKAPFHHAARIEWTNLDQFPKLKISGRKYIVFRVVSKQTQPRGTNRWNDEYQCEILLVKWPGE
ncbi:MAG: hypothetical protein ABIP75_04570 [Pyrinomonadaceae bacterium]